MIPQNPGRPGGNLEVRYASGLITFARNAPAPRPSSSSGNPNCWRASSATPFTTTRFNPSLAIFFFLVPSISRNSRGNTEQLVLVVDGATANFPWEMVTTSESPVRDPAGPEAVSCWFRRRPATNNGALVAGNPSTPDSARCFPTWSPIHPQDRFADTGAESGKRPPCGDPGTGLRDDAPDAGEDAQTVLSAPFRRPTGISTTAHGPTDSGADGQARSGGSFRTACY